MEIRKVKLNDLKNINDLVNASINGTSFSYDFFLKLKKVKNILCVHEKDKLIAFMPLFENKRTLNQSTMYIPYGGPVILYNFNSYRKQLLYTREVINLISTYLKENYDSISFSMDPSLIDIIPLVKNGFVPEVRYTYKIDLSNDINDIYNCFGRDRKRNIKNYNNIEIIFDDKLNSFDFKKALVWEYNYGNDISDKFTKEYLKAAISNNKGKVLLAKLNNKVLGGIAVVLDNINCYIMYSYYDKEYTSVIPTLYYELIKYLKDNNICKFLDFEGSVFKEIEEWNLSFGAKQVLYFNFYYEKNDDGSLYKELYDYGDKNEKQF